MTNQSYQKTSNTPRRRYVSSHGYVCVYRPSNPAADKKGYVYEHRVIMEMHLGRYLAPSEEVHHIDHNKQNNDIQNLCILSSSEHHKLHRHEQLLKKEKTKEQIRCPICNKKISLNARRCKECSNKHRVSKCPSREELYKILFVNNLTSASILLGVSTSAIRKWIKKLGVKYTPKWNSSAKGKRYTQEERLRMSNKIKAFYETHPKKWCKKVGQYDLQENLLQVFGSIRETETFGFNPRSVSKAALGHLKTYRNFRWRFI